MYKEKNCNNENLDIELTEELKELKNFKQLTKKQRYRRNKRLKKKMANDQKSSIIDQKQAKQERIKSLQNKIKEKRIQRSSKITKEHMIETTLKKHGIDKTKLMKDLEEVKKQGGIKLKT